MKREVVNVTEIVSSVNRAIRENLVSNEDLASNEDLVSSVHLVSSENLVSNENLVSSENLVNRENPVSNEDLASRENLVIGGSLEVIALEVAAMIIATPEQVVEEGQLPTNRQQILAKRRVTNLK